MSTERVRLCLSWRVSEEMWTAHHEIVLETFRAEYEAAAARGGLAIVYPAKFQELDWETFEPAAEKWWQKVLRVLARQPKPEPYRFLHLRATALAERRTAAGKGEE